LSKASFSFSANDFVIGKHTSETDPTEIIFDKLNVCVESCCTADSGNVGNCPCANNECKPEENGTSVVPGSYKFSILAAAFDQSDLLGDVAYEAPSESSAGNGWGKVISTYGAIQYSVVGSAKCQTASATCTAPGTPADCVDPEGPTYRVFESMAEADCRSKCDNIANCQAYEWTETRCYLHGTALTEEGLPTDYMWNAGSGGGTITKAMDIVMTNAYVCAVKTSPDKALAASLDYYQVIDFTNMKADTLTVTPKSGAGTTYMDMTDCALSTENGDCNPYEVHAMTVQSDGWAADYEFPETYNLGEWTMDNADKITTVPSETKMVQIRCVKPDAATLVAWGYAKASADDAGDLPVVADTKVVLLQYKFDISGLSATTTMGGWMAYDPTISTHVSPTPAPTPTPTQVPATPTPTAVSGGSGGSGENATTNATTLAPTTGAPSGSGVASGAISKIPSLLALGGSLLALAHMLK